MNKKTPVKQVRLAVVGAGNRGQSYAKLAQECGARIVAVAEPRQAVRQRFANDYGITSEAVFDDWPALLDAKLSYDAVLIATPDRQHVEPAIAFAADGRHILLEKPMAPTEAECRRIVHEVKAAGVIFAVCHVLRYTDYTQAIRKIIAEGLIGDVICIQHHEPIGYWHHAHSYVRGNWRSEAESSSALLAKSCHDLDWLRFIMGRRCIRVSSFGSLVHFRPENQPKGASDRCLDCDVESSCPYSARRIYLEAAHRGETHWPVSMLDVDPTPANVEAALRQGPYGHCVYTSGNDVVDQQVVNMEFDSGRTASFTMSAFTPKAGRATRIFGSRGQLVGDGSTIQRYDFLTEQTFDIDTQAADQSLLGGHGGGDGRLIQSFVSAVAQNDPSLILSGPDETLESHLMVFAAERARKQQLGECVNT